MLNTSQPQLPESSDQQTQKLSPPLSNEGMRQPTEVSAVGDNNETFAETLGVDGTLIKPLEIGPNQKTFGGSVIMVNRCEDVLESLIPFAAEKEMFILGATGTLSYVELLNQPEYPVTKTALHGNLEIVFLDGNIVHPKRHGKNHASHVTILVTGEDGQIRGGPVRRLISKTPVQIVVGEMSRSAITSLAAKQYLEGNELPPFPDLAEVENQIYKATLKELNQTNP